MLFSGYPAGNTTSGVKKLLEKPGYSEKAIGYYLKKVNVGSIENPSAKEAYTGPCGDTLEVYLKIESNVIKDAKFQAIGCAGAFASGSALMEIIKGKALDEAEKITACMPIDRQPPKNNPRGMNARVSTVLLLSLQVLSLRIRRSCRKRLHQ